MKRKPIHTYDIDRQPIVLIPLGGKCVSGQFAKLLEEDYNDLLSKGYSPNWCVNEDGSGRNQYVTLYCRITRTQTTISRLIIEPTKRQVIRYYDGNSLNLRRDNLYLEDRKKHIQKVLGKHND